MQIYFTSQICLYHVCVCIIIIPITFDPVGDEDSTAQSMHDSDNHGVCCIHIVFACFNKYVTGILTVDLVLLTT